jgi:hypothetical protein
MRVDIHPPVIDGDTVRFGWSMSAPNPWQRRDAFFYRYPGLDLTQFDPRLFVEMFLALELAPLGHLGGPTFIRLPFAMPRSSVDFWADYHRVVRTTVEIGPVVDSEGYDPRIASPDTRLRQANHAVFYSGGRDSGVVAELLRELGGPDDLLLVAIADDHFGAGSRSNRTRLIEEVVLEPAARRNGAATALVHTDYQATFLTDSRRPHLEYYYAGTLPVLLAQGATLASVGAERDSHVVYTGPGDYLRMAHRRSRPEWRAGITGHYKRTLGVDLDAANLAAPLGQTNMHRLAAERYPGMPQIRSCHRGLTAGWCYTCRKCSRHLVATLGIGAPDPTFDYDHALNIHPSISRTVARLPAALPPPGENTGWMPGFTEDWQFAEHCHWLAGIVPDRVVPTLGDEARRRIALLRAHWGNRRWPVFDQIAEAGLSSLPASLRTPYAEIMRQHFAMADDFPTFMLPNGSRLDPAWSRVDTPPPAVAAAARFAPGADR